MVCTAMVLEKKPCKSRICAFCTHLPFVFGGFAFGFTAISCFSFSCFFFHATATLKERSSSASEWSLGFTLNIPWAPPTWHWACHCCSRTLHFTPGYGTLARNTGKFASVGTGFTWSCRPCFSRSSRALASAAAFSVKKRQKFVSFCSCTTAPSTFSPSFPMRHQALRW